MKKKNGFSLIEVMVAISIVAVVAIVSARSFVSMKTSEVSLREADVCRSYLDSAFKNIDLYGVMPTMVDMSTVPNSYQTGDLTKFNDIKNAPMASVFPLNSQSLVTYVDSSLGLSQLNTPVLLGGTIAMLNGLYNKYANVCQAQLVYSQINQIVPGMPPGLSTTPNFSLNMTISPYDLLSGTVATGCAPIKNRTLVPKGVAASGISASVAGPYGPPVATYGTYSTVQNNTGFQVGLTAQFTTADNRIHSCSGTRNYSYPADLTGVGTITGSITQSSPPATITPKYAPDTVTMHLAYTGKPGTVLFCRDISTTADPGDNPGNYDFGDPKYIPLVKPPGKKYVPCERVTLCGKSQLRYGVSQAVFSRPNPLDPTTFVMDTKWPNSGAQNQGNQIPPFGCIPELQVVAVDMNGNVSPTAVDIKGVNLGALQNCYGEWSATCYYPPGNPSACGPTAGTQTFNYDWPKMYGGADCAIPAGSQRACPLACPVNCVGAWGACSASCGGGTQTYNYSTWPVGTGSLCPVANGAHQSCNTASCSTPAVNCSGHWGSCSVTCGPGTQTFYVDTPASNGGANCSANNGDTMSCNPAVCPPTPPTPTPVPTATPAPTATPTGCYWLRTASNDPIDAIKNSDTLVAGRTSFDTKYRSILKLFGLSENTANAGGYYPAVQCSIGSTSSSPGLCLGWSPVVPGSALTVAQLNTLDPIGTQIPDPADCYAATAGTAVDGVYGVVYTGNYEPMGTWTCTCGSAPPPPTGSCAVPVTTVSEAPDGTSTYTLTVSAPTAVTLPVLTTWTFPENNKPSGNAGSCVPVTASLNGPVTASTTYSPSNDPGSCSGNAGQSVVQSWNLGTLPAGSYTLTTHGNVSAPYSYPGYSNGNNFSEIQLGCVLPPVCGHGDSWSNVPTYDLCMQGTPSAVTVIGNEGMVDYGGVSWTCTSGGVSIHCGWDCGCSNAHHASYTPSSDYCCTANMNDLNTQCKVTEHHPIGGNCEQKN